MTNSTKLKGFKTIAIIAILWNIMGVISYFFHVFMPAEEIAKLSVAEQGLYQNIPTWKNIAFFIATVGGLLGSVLLFLKRKQALLVLILSLIGTVSSFYYDFFHTKLMDVYGQSSVVFPLIIILIGVFLVWYANKADAKNILS
jgi:hypothetical protein